MADLNTPVLQKAKQHFGVLKNKKIIDLGCGKGTASPFFAYHGANVISIDLSKVAIKNLSKYCKDNNISNIKPIVLPAHKLNSLGKVDYIFGDSILHHIEPFEEFSKILRNTIKTGGKGFFLENNAQSKTMIWFRQNIVGKLWVPKYGDEEEFPLTPSEVDELRKYFLVKIEHPEFLYFRMISLYLLRGHIKKPFEILDNYFYKFPKLRKYSYLQYLFLS